MTNGVIAQIDGILNVSIEDNPYYKVFSNIDNESLQNSAKELLINKINPAYKALNDFLKNEYLPNFGCYFFTFWCCYNSLQSRFWFIN